METTRNGFDLGALHEFLERMRRDPTAARITMQTHHRWAGAGAVEGLAHTLAIGDATLPRRFTVRSDFPEALGGRDTGPAPGELLLMALGACVSGAYAEVAALEGVELTALEATVEGSADLRGAFGIADVPASLSRAHILLQVRSDADDATLDALGQAALSASPVSASLTPRVRIELAVRRTN